MLRKLILLVSIPVLYAPASTQTFCETIGTQYDTAAASFGCPWLDIQDQNTCLDTACAIPSPPTWAGKYSTSFHCSGGTGFDNRMCKVWLTVDGHTLALHDPYTCLPHCPELPVAPPPPVGWGISPPMPPLEPAAYITGLAHTDSGDLGAPPVPPAPFSASWLWASWSQPLHAGGTKHVLSRIAATVGPPGAICDLKAEHCDISGWVHGAFTAERCTGGVAEDTVGRFVFVGVTSPTSPAPANLIGVFPMFDGAPWPATCPPMCQFPVPDWVDPGPDGIPGNADDIITVLGPLTGLAYDACSQTLCVCDVDYTFCGPFAFTPLGCSYTVTSCCPNPTFIPGAGSSRPWIGLDKMPEPITLHCVKCGTLSCNGCTPTIGTKGYPSMGNPDFAVTLTGLPDNYTTGVMAVNLGPCTPPGVGIGFCGPICVNQTIPSVFVFFLPVPGGGAGCSASFTLGPLVIPINPALCNLKVSVQAIFECANPGAPIGNAVSECLNLCLSGN